MKYHKQVKLFLYSTFQDRKSKSALHTEKENNIIGHKIKQTQFSKERFLAAVYTTLPSQPI